MATRAPFSIRGLGAWFLDLLRNPFLWGGLGVLLLIGVAGYFLFNHLVFPSYTRHGVAVEVPDVTNRPVEEAVRILESQNFRVEQDQPRFNPNIPRDVVLEQMPRPHAEVKPGRRIFLTINSGRPKLVSMPSVEGLSMREAVSQLSSRGLKVQSHPDSIPSPYPNTVTRQLPVPGDSLQAGAEVTLWYSTGLGNAYVEVPDVSGLTVAEARQQLLDSRLRYLVFRERADGEAATDEEEDENMDDLVVVRQSREPGTRVREGFELRIFVGEEGAGDRFF